MCLGPHPRRDQARYPAVSHARADVLQVIVRRAEVPLHRWISKTPLGLSVMETCVLIPKEFSLVLASDQSSCKSLFKNGSGTLVADVRISVWSNVFIPSGTLIYPFQGSIRFDKIDLYSLLDDNDVSMNTRAFF